MSTQGNKRITTDAGCLDRLGDALRHIAEQLRAEEPLLDAQKLAPHGEILQKAIEIFENALPDARIADKKDYLSLRAAWLEAWASDEQRMEGAASHALGVNFPPPPDDTRGGPWWRLRLLAVMLSHAGEARTRQLVQCVEESLLTTTELGFGLDIDREAHNALREWGRLDEAELLGRWKKLDTDLLKRAAKVIGLSAPKRWSETQRSEFHRRSRRFARNTFV